MKTIKKMLSFQYRKIIAAFVCIFSVGGIMLYFSHTRSYEDGADSEKTDAIYYATEAPTPTGAEDTAVGTAQVPDMDEINLRTRLNAKKQICTVRWKKYSCVASYELVCEKKGDDGWAAQETVPFSAGEKMVYRCSVSYGEKYRFMVKAYVEDSEDMLCYESDFAIAKCEAPPVEWLGIHRTNGFVEEIELLYYASYRKYDAYQADGFEIYCGTSEDVLSLIATVPMYGEKGDKFNYTTQNYRDYGVSENADCYYKIRSYTVIQGEKFYGEFSEIHEKLSGSEWVWGDASAKIICSEKEKIKKIEFAITNQTTHTMQFGKIYQAEEAKYAIYFTNDNEVTAFSFSKKAEISYKRDWADSYQPLTDETDLSFAPGETLYLRFRQKNHEEFYNPICLDGEVESNNILIYLFSYKGHDAFLSMHWNGTEWETYIKWGWQNQPWAYD